MFDYMNQALRTVSDREPESIFPPATIAAVLTTVMEAGAAADAIKKDMFYGKQPKIDPLDFVTQSIDDTFFEQPYATEHLDGDTFHAIIGVITEAAELAQELLIAMLDGRQVDETKIVDEGGDLLWYLNLAFDRVGVSWEEVMRKNIAKLSARFPEKFTAEAAIHRDEAKEMEALLSA